MGKNNPRSSRRKHEELRHLHVFFVEWRKLVKPANLDVLVLDNALWIVSLQGERAGRQDAREVFARLASGFFRPVVDDFVVQFDDDPFAFNDDVVFVPFVIFDVDFFYVVDGIDAAAFPPIALGLVDLDFVTVFRPTGFLPGSVNINAAV